MQLLVNQGVLKEPLETMLEDQIVPWMYDRIMGFLEEDEHVDTNIEELFSEGFNVTAQAHKEIVDADHEKKDKEQEERESLKKERGIARQ